MSYASINDVTVALAKLIESRIQQVDPAAVVTLLGPPTALPDLAGINLYLCRVWPDVHGREPMRVPAGWRSGCWGGVRTALALPPDTAACGGKPGLRWR